MLIHGRKGALAAGVVIALALLAPSTALAGHDLVIYKAEAHVDLSSDELVTSVSCNPGDHALDGMWRVDHADQDDYVPDLELISGAIDVIRAEATSDSTYTFQFLKNAIGRAQLKIFVTCLANQTSGSSHQHTFSSSAAIPNGSFYQQDGTTPTTPGGFSTQTTNVIGSNSAVVPVVNTATASCPTGFVLVSPGFRAQNYSPAWGGDTIAGMMRLFESNSTLSAKDWTWRFENSALPDSTYTMDIVTSWRCLRIKIPKNGFDSHKLIPKWKSPKTFNPLKNRVSEGQYNCGDHYKAIVAGFRIPQSGGDLPTYAKDGSGLFSTPPSNTAFNNVFYLGMDRSSVRTASPTAAPRPRTT
jgi:hypothetical protein